MRAEYQRALQSMTDILTKLREATGPSRELDFFVHLVLEQRPDDPPIDCFSRYDGHEFIFDYGDQRTGVWGNNVVPYYTEVPMISLFPSHLRWGLNSDPAPSGEGGFIVRLDDPSDSDFYIEERAPTAPLAILIAIFEARKNEQG